MSKEKETAIFQVRLSRKNLGTIASFYHRKGRAFNSYSHLVSTIVNEMEAILVDNDKVKRLSLEESLRELSLVRTKEQTLSSESLVLPDDLAEIVKDIERA